jgi:hypothetical protein
MEINKDITKGYQNLPKDEQGLGILGWWVASG